MKFIYWALEGLLTGLAWLLVHFGGFLIWTGSGLTRLGRWAALVGMDDEEGV